MALSSLLVQAKPEKITPLATGAAAPDFSLPATDGKTYKLKDFSKAKYLVVIFTSNHCPDARASRGRINSFAKNYKDKGVDVVSISSNDPKALLHWEYGYSVYGDSFAEMKKVAEEEKYVFPFLYDGKTQEVAKAYGALATPHTFVFGPERKLLYQGQFDNGRRNPGPASNNVVKDIIDSYLAGKPSKVTSARTFGCSTKWSWKEANAVKAQKEWEALPVEVATLDVKTAKILAQNKTDKIRVINFWGTACGPCVAEFPELVDAYRRYQRRGVELITISLDDKDDADKVKKFLTKQTLPLSPHGKKSVEKEGRTTNNYHFQSDDLDGLANAVDAKWTGPMPHTVVIAPGGNIVFRHTGQLDIVELRRAIVKQLESGQKGE